MPEKTAPQGVPVSIHAPVGGRDGIGQRIQHQGQGFNPRARGRARRAKIQRKYDYGLVSIHAPVGGRD